MNPADTPSAYRSHFQNKAIADFFAKVPWCISGAMQQKEMLKKALIGEVERFGALRNSPKFSIITPCWNTAARYIEELIYSCVLQSWTNWELLLVDNGSTRLDHLEVITAWSQRDARIKLIRESKNLGISGGRNRAIAEATGTYICILDHDDIIHPQVLGLFGRFLLERPDTALIYSNEVKLSDDSTGISDFYSKPQFSLAGLERTNYICHFAATQRRALDRAKLADGVWFDPTLDGVEDHDAFLRVAQLPDARFEHIPVFAYFWRVCAGSTASAIGEKPYVYDRARTMLDRHLRSRGKHSVAEVGVNPATDFPRQLYSIHYRDSDKARATIVIPYRDRPDLTIKLLASLARQTGIKKHAIILADNRSSEPTTKTSIAEFLAKSGHEFGLVVQFDFDEPFNYARINNCAVRAHGHNEFVVFINNDVELTNPRTLSYMIGELEAHDKTGLVGIRLTLGDGHTIQHAGIRALPSPVGLGLFTFAHILNRNGDLPFDERAVFANTFACVATRRSLFMELGGLEEMYFPNGCGDVDMAIRARRAGFESFYLGTISAIHHESATRMTADESVEAVMLSRQFGSELASGEAHRFSHTEGLDLLSKGQNGMFRLPLRYRVADRINDAVKQYLKPAHVAFKKALQATR